MFYNKLAFLYYFSLQQINTENNLLIDIIKELKGSLETVEDKMNTQIQQQVRLKIHQSG